jgi:hypothetical protein
MAELGAQTDPDFAFVGIPAIDEAPGEAEDLQATAQTANPLGNLAELEGKWVGEGFNAIWRPFHPSAGDPPSQDRFLELNLTTDTIKFTKINGPIPNRGLEMHDINMFGLTYFQQISERNDATKGLHVEPGIWAHVPRTSNPHEGPTVVRMASIPHGTVILAQGQGLVVNSGPQIADNNILPFGIGGTPPPSSSFDLVAQTFPELDLSRTTKFRFESPGVTEDMVKNPNSVIQHAISGQNITRTVVLHVSTKHTPVKGGGTANTAFLEAATSPPGGNADAVEVDAIFWIETVAGSGGHPDTLQLQYTQLVNLNFNGLTWPHVTVATLKKQ